MHWPFDDEPYFEFKSTGGGLVKLYGAVMLLMKGAARANVADYGEPEFARLAVEFRVRVGRVALRTWDRSKKI